MKEPLAHREDLDHMVFSAFRYALGRCTYITWTTAQFIKNNLDLVPVKFRKLMINEITEAEEWDKEFKKPDSLSGRLGMDCDAKCWLDLREFLKESLKNEQTTNNV